MGVVECQITEELTSNELEDLRSHLIGQCSDGFFEGMEQHPIKTADFGEVYVSFWNDSDDWSLQTSEEMGFEQTEILSEEPEINMTMTNISRCSAAQDGYCSAERRIKEWRFTTISTAIL